MSLEELVNDYCNCILDEHCHDFLDVKVFDSEIAFFKKYDSFFRGKTKIENWNSNILIQQYTYKSCNNYFKKSLLFQHTPYDFYDSTSMRKHIECLKDFFLKKYKKVLPYQIEQICIYISLKGEEFQNIQTYFNEQIEFISEYKAGLLHGEIEEFRETLNDISDKSINLNGQIDNLDKEIKVAEKEIEKAENRSAKKMTEASVTILGIFSAVILTFNGVLSLIASGLQNINGVSVYRLVLISLILGLISFNLIFGLFNYLNIFRNKISSKEEEEPLKKQKNKSLIVFWVTDIILVVLMVLTVIAWWCGTVEARNNKIYHKEIVSEYSTNDYCKTNSDDICYHTKVI